MDEEHVFTKHAKFVVALLNVGKFAGIGRPEQL
jgi:hypothetical protein